MAKLAPCFFIALIFRSNKKSNKADQRPVIYALTVYLLFVTIGATHLLIMRSSTAAIGLFYLPLYALVPSAIAYVFGTFHDNYKRQKAKSNTAPQDVGGMILCVLLLVGAFGWQFTELQETIVKNSERDFKQSQRNSAIKENKRDIDRVLAYQKGNEGEKLTEIANGTTDNTMLIPVASNRYASAELLDRLSRINNTGIRIAVSRNQNTTSSTLEWIFNNSQYSNYYYSDLARNKNTPELILRTLYEKRHLNGGIPWSLAGNESTPIDILKKLVNEKDENVIRHLKNNKAYSE